MQKNNLASRISIGICILLLMVVFTNIGFAQSEEVAPELYLFNYVQVKPGMDLEFETFIKNALPTLQQMGTTQMTVYKTSNFGVSGKYLFTMPLPEPAVLDAELSQSQENIPVQLVSMLSALERTVVSSNSFMLIPNEDLSIPTAENYEQKLVVHLTIGTAPGRSQDFEKEAKEILDIIGETNVKGVYVSKVGYGGNLDEYIVSIFYDSFADMTRNTALVETKLAESGITPQSGVVYYRQSEILVRIPELSIEPAE